MMFDARQLTLSFKKTWSRNCTAADYEPWTPLSANASAPDCHLGQRETYTRRKADADCDVAFDAPLTAESEPCACSEADYLCDFCFERVGDQCVPQQSERCFNGLAFYRQCRPATNVAQNITFLSGYVLQPNNVCNDTLPGAVAHPFVTIPCQQVRGICAC